MKTSMLLCLLNSGSANFKFSDIDNCDTAIENVILWLFSKRLDNMDSTEMLNFAKLIVPDNLDLLLCSLHRLNREQIRTRFATLNRVSYKQLML